MIAPLRMTSRIRAGEAHAVLGMSSGISAGLMLGPNTSARKSEVVEH